MEQREAKKREQQESSLGLYLRQVAADRTKVPICQAGENFYLKRASIMETASNITKEIANLKNVTKKVVQSKCFPSLEVKSGPESLKINTSFTINETLLSDTAFHKETLDRIGLLKPK
jgi:hypothetical protein